jgi:cytochrome c oxidase subunit II
MRSLRLPVLALVLSAGAVAASCGGSSDEASDTTVKLSAEATAGKAAVAELGCSTCHSVDGSDGVGPTWKGLAGSKVELDSGKTVTADDAYLTRAITKPGDQVVAGFKSIMPERDLPDDQVASIVAYLNALG